MTEVNKPLPLKEIFLKGLKTPFQNITALLRLGIPFIFLMILMDYLIPHPPEISFILYFFIYIVYYLAFVLSTIGCHRVFLLSDEAIKSTPVLRWTKRETRFLLIFFGFSVIYSAAAAISYNLFTLLPENHLSFSSIMAILMLPATYCISRWSLILPATATDQQKSLRWAWSISSNHQLRLFVLIGLLPILTSQIISYLPFLPYYLNFVYDLIWLIVGVIEICILSLAYEWVAQCNETTAESG
ncbi:hypothetical protein H0A36_24990 [Endozoicomonas sp. SM1973]|uniref:Uncharacterized protein n=1 Tax=Spartinivicinus marinus TaxID=2994442 RepID=A0A853I8U8_9GAMM|nr:hypothetical protein [Spartinivicinus marinus]MCX4030326.1 hypothetical protein [Spartinivicinus marinus]NYZ69279.1 hypothetical protein [Spartinivicinus marinus]